MRKENVATYNEDVARNIVKSENYRYYDGNKIGTVENLVAQFTDALFQINRWANGEIEDGPEIKDAVNNYKAVRYCYNGDTSGMDDKINEKLEKRLHYIDRLREQIYKLKNR